MRKLVKEINENFAIHDLVRDVKSSEARVEFELSRVYEVYTRAPRR